MTSEAQELLKMIDGHIETYQIAGGTRYLEGMRSIRQLVKNFYAMPVPIKEPKLTEEDRKIYEEDEEIEL